MPVQPSQFIAEDANQQFKEAKQSRGIFPSENEWGWRGAVCKSHRFPALNPCYSNCGPWTSSISNTWECVRSKNLQLCPRPTESESLWGVAQETVLSRSPGEFSCTVKFENLRINQFEKMNAYCWWISERENKKGGSGGGKSPWHGPGSRVPLDSGLVAT